MGTIFSNQGYLFVEVDKQNTTNCIIECSASTTKSDVETTPEITATGTCISILCVEAETYILIHDYFE